MFTVPVLLSAAVERVGVSRMRDFFNPSLRSRPYLLVLLLKKLKYIILYWVVLGYLTIPTQGTYKPR